MLKRIALSELELGMFVHKMEGGWFDHPFWKSKFLIADKDKLQVLRSSRLQGVVIDTSRGKDVTALPCEAPAQASAASNQARARIQTIAKRSKHQPSLPMQTTTVTQELGAAQAIADKAKENLSRAFIDARLGKALNVNTVQPVVDDILASVRRSPQAFSGLMRCKLRNELMFRHSLAVSALMVSLARVMKLPPNEVHNCGLAGLLLDIGVNYLPQGIDPPNGDYRNVDPAIWQQHVMLGHRALLNDCDLPQLVLDACLQHHERIDGRGFPNGLAGDDITQVARMAAICDSFDFLLSSTNTSAALDPALAVQHMQNMKGAFDEDILRHFVESIGIYPVGSFVVLRSEKLAMVIDEDAKDYSRPVVQAFYSYETGERILPHRIELARSASKDEIVGIADLSGLGLPDDDLLREMVFLTAHNFKE
jgi:HD-GYP domain-containing protein (c-di-GMP phosphodiesterase class II)